MKFPRGSGILLHPTSLPTRFGIGDLGPAAHNFVDSLVAAAQKYWQILPQGPTGEGNSPYSSYSAFAGNTLLISPEALLVDGLIDAELLEIETPFDEGRVDFDRVAEWKKGVLNAAFETLRSTASVEIHDEFTSFCREHFWWLDDYALFVALKQNHDGKAWFQWAKPLRQRDEASIATIRSQLAREIQAEQFAQFLFYRQWAAVKKYANDKGIFIIGDIPIFVAYDSADVWCNQSKFKLDADGKPLVVSGVPPDYFSKTGQLWGNPIYDWQAMQRDDFGWWTARIAFALRSCDAVRLDHFIGFIRNWEIPYGDETAENGAWAEVPGRALFSTLRRRLGDVALIAEDLGSLTPEVEALRDDCGMPGMRILQYAFGGDAHNSNLPHNYIQNSVSYTGTHDNDTTVGWYDGVPANVKAHLKEYLKTSANEVNWDLICASQASVADVSIIPMQDLLGLGSEFRMNTPATETGNWAWRYGAKYLTATLLDRLNELAKLYGR